MGMKKTFLEYLPDRTIVKVTMLDGKVIKEKIHDGQKFLFNGSSTLNFGIKELKRAGAPKHLIAEYKQGSWEKFTKAVEAKLASGAKK